MIFNNIHSRDLFIFNIFMQIFLSFVLISGNFYSAQHNQKYLDNKVTDVLDSSNVLDGISTPATDRTTDKTNIDILDAIYDNSKGVEDVLNDGLEKSIYLQIIIFVVGFLISSTIINISRREYVKNLIDLILVFLILGCMSVLVDTYITQKYTTLSLKDIYDIIQSNLGILKSSRSY